MADRILEALDPHLQDQEPEGDVARGKRQLAEELDDLIVILRTKAELAEERP